MAAITKLLFTFMALLVSMLVYEDSKNFVTSSAGLATRSSQVVPGAQCNPVLVGLVGKAVVEAAKKIAKNQVKKSVKGKKGGKKNNGDKDDSGAVSFIKSIYK